MTGAWEGVVGPAGTLRVHEALGTSTPSTQANALVICHGFPIGADAARHVAQSLPALADRLAAESGWRVVAGCLRGVGESDGDFSLRGWFDDLRAIVDHATALAMGGGVWIVGFGTGGSLGLCVGFDDGRVRGAACFGSRATFADWAHDARSMLAYARRVGVVRSAQYPDDLGRWGAAFTELDPAEAARKMAPRPVLVVHGADDEEVPLADARRLADTAGPGMELHVLAGAGHRLRADPRAIALLVGWLERQGP